MLWYHVVGMWMLLFRDAVSDHVRMDDAWRKWKKLEEEHES